ncbi:MAG: DpnD/PcfM family protein [Coprobacillus sp.]|nr:DpnD/PcfM family protein [Coprobacillus sp.]
MKRYQIIIEETISGTFEVDASSPEKAVQIARDKYKCSDFVNEPGDLEEVRFLVFDEKGDISIDETL